MPTLIPRVFFGSGTTAHLYRWGTGPTDDGDPVVVRLRSARFAPGGVGGEAAFYALHPVVAYSAAVTLRFTPIVDEVVYDGSEGPTATVEVVLPQPPSGRRTWYKQEIGLSVPLVRDTVERGRLALRGTWFQLQVDIVDAIGSDLAGRPGVVALEGVEVSFALVGVTATALPSPEAP